MYINVSKSSNKNEARQRVFKRISDRGEKGPFAKLKELKLFFLYTTDGLINALREYGWKSTRNYFEPECYSGSAVPESLRDSPTTPTEDGDPRKKTLRKLMQLL